METTDQTQIPKNPGPTRAWTKRQAKAIALVADDFLTDERIASECGINRRTLWSWKQKPEFRAAVMEARAAIYAQVTDEGIADKNNRIARINDTRKRLLTVIAERAADATNHGVAGGETGALVRQAKIVKVYNVKAAAPESAENPKDSGVEVLSPEKRTVVVCEWAFDGALFEELRALEMQAARELGQVIDKKDVTHRGPFVIEMTNFGDGSESGESAPEAA